MLDQFKGFLKKYGKPQYLLMILFFIGIIFGVWSRIWHFTLPNKEIFDEVYFPKFAYRLLQGELVFDVHPPLGKIIMAIGIAIFGNNTLGWRITPLVFGMGNIILFGLIVKEMIGAKIKLTQNSKWFLFGIGLFVMALDPMLVLYSRVGLMDGVLFFFTLLTLYFAYKQDKVWMFYLMWISFGLLCSIKWLGLGMIVPIVYLSWLNKRLWQVPIGFVLSVGIYLLVVIDGLYLGGKAISWSQILLWHEQTWHYHAYLTDTHPWGSKWYTWPYVGRPILMLYDYVENEKISVMTLLGNPIMVWTSSLAVVGSFGYLISRLIVDGYNKTIRHPLVVLMLGYLAMYLPFIKITRVMFNYHYLSAYIFALLMWIYWIYRLWEKKLYWLVLIIMIGVMFTSVFFMPLANGFPLTKTALDGRVWFHSWLY